MVVRKKSGPAPEEPPTPVRLSSWKEIAAYLQRDPRTVQQWEKKEGLPVHRLEHQTRASVYAYTNEIDAWLEARSGLSLAEQPEEQTPEQARFPRYWPLFKLSPFLILLLFVLAVIGVDTEMKSITRRHKASAAADSPLAPVLAVMPFEDQTSTEGVLAGNLTDSLIADFDRIGKFAVISPQSVSSFKGEHLPLQQVADRLHASLVLRGTVAKTEDRLQVTVELLEPSHNTHLWGATYTRNSADGSPSLCEIASGIAVEATRKITGSAPAVALPNRDENPKARQAYLTGRFYWNQRDLPSLEKAIASFQRAISIDPKYADAYAGLAETYDLMTDRGVLSDAEAFRRARNAAQTALALNPANANAYNALGMVVYRENWDFTQAEKYFQKAIALNPNYAVAHQWYGEFLGDMRRFDQSIAELRKAEELDPLAPMVGSDLADGYLHARRLAEANTELQRVLDLYPNFPPAHLYRIQVYTRQGDFSAAESEAQTYLRLTHDSTPLQVVEIERMAAMGDLQHARTQLSQLLAGASGRSLKPYQRAQLDFFTRQDDMGYTELESAYRARSWWLVTMLVDPEFDAIHTRPRFLALARRVGMLNPSNREMAHAIETAQGRPLSPA
ncbi:MAG: tetratricopeptide repeat protein [Terracidiphilus sp.]